ncbi:MAG: class I SAM-dependent methyltransferase [Pseudomonadota bacterium]
MARGYQKDFSLHSSNVHDLEGRRRKAKTVELVLRDAIGDELQDAALIDVGASTGAIVAMLSESVARAVGIDIDEHAIAFARKEFAETPCIFRVGDAMNVDADDGEYDLVLCQHVYEHVPDVKQLMTEISRVLKPGGWCYFSAGNRFAITEPHYQLPFLSWPPKPLANLYLRALKRGKFYYEEHLSWWGLKDLVKDFEVVDYTRRLIVESDNFQTDYMVPMGSLKQRVAKNIVDYAIWACPGYIWMLRKP